jgi:diguanylate cyclase (GGDEF)-like protein/putative nucleotidyltransferase with HDIG domain
MDVLSGVTPAITPDALDDVAEPRETGGVTTKLILQYVEREGGRVAVEELLGSTGLTGREEQLRDSNHWSSYATKIAMLDAAAKVLGDPLAARHMGHAGMDFNVAPALILSLRALGSLRILYKNIARTCSKFTTTHRMDALEVGAHHARIAYTDVSGTGYHAADCELNVGFLACAPGVFGLPLARISHPVCARDGGDTCIYEIRWQPGAARLRTALVSGLAAAASLGLGLALTPSLVPEEAALAVAALAYGATAEFGFRRRRWKALQQRADHQAEVTDRLATSLQDLVSGLRLDEVLAKVTKHAQTAVGGKEFVLLVDEADGMRCRSSSTIPQASIDALEAWAAGSPRARDEATVIEDLSQVEALAPLAADRLLPLRSLCSAPLVYGGSSLGVLVALANGARGFLPNDVDLLQSYAAQAAIAVANARLFAAQEELASRDPLTGLHNHREFHEAVAAELDLCRRGRGALSVVLLDLDDFKRVNDTGGHAAGDRVLVAAAEELRSCCRDSDVAFRVGGDEFALVLPRTGAEQAHAVAERLGEAVRRIEGRVGVSFGVAEWPADGPTKDAILASADERLYVMKRSASWDYEARAAAAADGDDSQRERLSCASRLSAKLLPLVDPDEIAVASVDELHAAFRYHLAVIHRIDPDGMLRPVAGAGPLVREMTGFEAWAQPVDHGINGRVARTGEPALVHDTSADPDFLGTDAPADSGSELAVAIRVNGRVWGVLNLEHLATHAFDADDVVFADLVAAHIGAALDRARLRGELEGTLMTTLAALCDALEHKDAYTAAHAHDVADLSEAVAKRIGLEGAELRNVRYAALLHDIGKIGIRTEILVKPGKLTDAEFTEMKQHTLIGQRILEPIPFFTDVHQIVRWAHERWDGSGYPDGIAAGDIPLAARIICACDAFHAMTSDRPYRAAMPVADAVAELHRHSGSQFDPQVVDALVEEAVGAGGRG